MGANDGPRPSSAPGVPHLAPEAVVRLTCRNDLLAAWLCTPERLEDLAAGWLLCEGIVRGREEILRLHGIGAEEVGVELVPAALARRAARDSVSGPGPAASEQELLAGVPAGGARGGAAVAELVRDTERIQALFRGIYACTPLRDAGGGVHCGGLVTGGNLVDVVEDVSRHAVVDKLLGAALLAGGVPEDALLLLSGRISAPIAAAAARGGAAAVASLSVPTTLAARIAARAGVTLVARARRGSPEILPP